MRATIRDIAREAGVSVSTVTYALNKHRRDGAVTRESHRRVLEAVARLGYVPDATARSLVKGRTNSIGVVLPPVTTFDFSNPYFMQLLSELSGVLADRGHWLSLHMPRVMDTGFMRGFIEDAKIDGLIWLVHAIPPGMEEVLHNRGLPHVTIEYGREPVHRGNVVLLDDYAGTAQAVDHLYTLGHRDILYISGYPPGEDLAGRTGAFIERTNALGGCTTEILYGGYVRRGAYDAVTARLARGGHGFTAVLAASDLMALGAMDALRDNGVKVPDRVSIMGFDDITPAREAGLTTMAQPLGAMVRAACDAVMDGDATGIAGDRMVRRFIPEPVFRTSTHMRGFGP